MAMDFGVSFNPGQAKNPMDPQQKGSSQTPIQDAIRTLSLRIPSFRGPGIVPQPLLTSPGSAGVMGGGMPGGLQQILQQIFGQMPQQGNAQASSVPTPHFTPGQGPAIPQPPVNPPQMPDLPFTNPQMPDQGQFFPGNWPRQGQ